jgi:hypothetical protein
MQDVSVSSASRTIDDVYFGGQVCVPGALSGFSIQHCVGDDTAHAGSFVPGKTTSFSMADGTVYTLLA